MASLESGCMGVTMGLRQTFRFPNFTGIRVDNRRTEEIKLVPQKELKEQLVETVQQLVKPEPADIKIKAEITAVEIQPEILNAEHGHKISPKDDTSPKVQVTSLLATDMVVPTMPVTPLPLGNKWNNMSPKIREPPTSANIPNVHVLHGPSSTHVHNPRYSRRIQRSNNNAGAYKEIQITPVHIEPPSPSGLKTQLADPVLSQDDGDPIIGGELIRVRTGG